ncbi:hypothetical protein [Lentilactobacillus hilgardii]|nr:hypothetical protein [Lentilactobacillus hilgardii]
MYALIVLQLLTVVPYIMRLFHMMANTVAGFKVASQQQALVVILNHTTQLGLLL